MKIFPTTRSVELQVDGSWLTVWFNQPERRNPLTDDVIDDLAEVFHALKEREDIRGVTLRGRGGYFCAGGDLKGFGRLAEGPREDAMRVSTLIGEVLWACNELPQVTIAVIEGAAMAGGLGLACCCDVALGMNDAKFGFSETRIGITPAQIARYVIQKCGYAVGRRLMLTAARFDGAQAAEVGVLDGVATDTDALNALERSVRADVLSCAPGAIAACKSLIIGLERIPDHEKVHFAAENFTRCLRGPEGKEGVASFIEKRRPIWFEETS